MKILRALVLLLVPIGFAFGAEGPKEVTPESVLADQVKAIATSRISTKEKDKSIASAVKFAVTAATSGIDDPAQVLKIALKFTTAAAKAAPGYVDAIMNGVSGMPALADVDGAVTAILQAVTDTAKDSIDSGTDTNRPSVKPSSTPDFSGNTGDAVVSPTT